MNNNLNVAMVENFLGMCVKGIVINKGEEEPIILENFQYYNEGTQFIIKNTDTEERIPITNIKEYLVRGYEDYIHMKNNNTDIFIEDLAI
ncbi:hypothetical protein [Clostridium tagluense]|uniref:Uncharacterized protein n=1 Tax=Clostridium tagluense TaxID=360422 RepID=A0A401UPD6_9CLOT|nr:hypothetical protein [Clostridium tagluense]GCD11402.1 hypothetical protein Ctaglu_30250 [Clostridium tagluense]